METKEIKTTRSDILGMISGQQKIAIIKKLREVTGLGLKESKDEIEKYIRDDGALREYDMDGIINLFLPYIEGDIQSIKLKIEKGVECALTNYLIMGFSDPFDAVRMVIDNLQHPTSRKGLIPSSD